MFSWNIAKSAEGMFSRWAVKRLCKFLLKKKLGQFILGDIDLDQLDVQLGAGTIQLADLALNVDFLNDKLGDLAAVTIKEGSIASLLVTMPWKGKGCQIEIDELEVVIGPYRRDVTELLKPETCIANEGFKPTTSHNSGTHYHEKVSNASTMDVHEGVKAIAKMVKLLLTSFHVKVKKLIVAFDDSTETIEKHTDVSRTLILRVSDIECGTSISEDVNTEADNFLGLSQLTNFVKFEGAVLEFLHSEAILNPGSSFGERFSSCPSSAKTPVITGQRGVGFSGTLKLSMPWKNGTPDTRRVNADIYVDPLEIRFQPKSLAWLLDVWEVIKISGENNKGSSQINCAESVYFNALSASTFSGQTDRRMMQSCNKSYPSDSSFSVENVLNVLLSDSHVISDWVPLGFSESKNNGIVEEPDFEASFEQFFECVDELRSSQSALGNSGVWNWTCSVFSAINAASNLSSGSQYIPTDQQHVQTNLKVTISGISVILSLLDNDQQQSCGVNNHLKDIGSKVHYIAVKSRDIQIDLQVCPQQINVKATVEQVDVTDCFSYAKDPMNGDLNCYAENVESQISSIHQVQAAVQNALPLFSTSNQDAEMGKQRTSLDGESSSKCNSKSTCVCIYREDVVKVNLFKTLGVVQFKLNKKSSPDTESSTGSSSFSLKLPEFVLWVNFDLISLVLSLFSEVGEDVKKKRMRDCSTSNGVSCQQERERNSCPQLTKSTQERLRGHIFLPKARLILGFPVQNDGDFSSYISWNRFVVLDLTPPLSLLTEDFPIANPQKKYSLKTSQSLHLNMGNLEIYLISSAHDNLKQKFLPQKIISVTSENGRLSVVSILWQEGVVTGSWVTKRAKLLATSEDSRRSRNRFVGKGFEFTSVASVKNMENNNSHAREEIISSSSMFIHAKFPSITVKLNAFEYNDMHNLLHQLSKWIACIPHDQVGNGEEAGVDQSSVFVECDSAEVSICLSNIENVKGPIESELPGSWHSLKLQIKKFDLLSVSNVGGICDAKFLSIAHGEGNLWGSITGVSDQEFSLISCTKSTTGRGDGEGSNILTLKPAGTDIVFFWDPEGLHTYTCINVWCCTIVAIGGRLDWFDAIASFFHLPSPENEQSGDTTLSEEKYAQNKSCGSTFDLNLVDVGLSYEPYLKNFIVNNAHDCDSSFVEVDEETVQYFAGILAASSLKLSNKSLAACSNSVYKIRLQDLGLLICPISKHNNFGGSYSVENLRKLGYVKVAQEALLEASIRTNPSDCLVWEVECPESHIYVGTCHDTTFGLIRLAAQLQQIYAPDMEELMVHLQTRWNNVQQAQAANLNTVSSVSSSTQERSSCSDGKNEGNVTNWMDEIRDGAFDFNGQASIESNLETKSSESRSCDVSVSGSVPIINLETGQASVIQTSFPGLIEGYFLTELHSSPKVSNDNLSPHQTLNPRSCGIIKRDVEEISNGWYEDSSLMLVENHVSRANKEANPQQLGAGYPSHSNCKKLGSGSIKGRVSFKSINICWRMYGGSDWHVFREDAQNPPRISGRDKTVCLELALYGVDLQYDVYPEGGIHISRLLLSAKDCHLTDKSKDAPWKLVLGYYQKKGRPRESSSKAFKLELEAIRPDPLTPLEEYRTRVMLLPMRLHLHQSQLDFLINFFGGRSSSEQSSSATMGSDEFKMSRKSTSNLETDSFTKEALLPFVQKFDVWPILIRVDYIPHRLDLAALRGGKYVELVNLVPWKGVELQLKHVQSVGIYGWSSVCETVIGEWLEDISQNQIHKVLRGLPPIRSLVAVGSGTAKLVSLPLKNYRKDHRVLKGVQRGTIAFLRSVSLEAVGLGVHLAASAHDILLQAEYILSSIPPSAPWSVQSRTKTDPRSNQPKDARQGIQQAYESISDGLGKSASALVQNPVKQYQRGAGVGSALVTAVQAAPAAAIAPASATARAVHCALLGMRNSLDPEHKKESLEKYMGCTQPWEHITGDMEQ
ncbi:autophagy-related protein 2 [Impatiens glandulifera]|uniref:autophagy-related protein 2 n=1 Tax=Impatiens glandulifera TaxID=253017 RepID=UPI001FB162F3|nr:autophagy-related protein 2 [Impatiens glandulifera]